MGWRDGTAVYGPEDSKRKLWQNHHRKEVHRNERLLSRHVAKNMRLNNVHIAYWSVFIEWTTNRVSCTCVIIIKLFILHCAYT